MVGDINTKNWFKFAIGFVGCLLIRLIPFRLPNIEPIMATNMPFSKAYGAYAGFFFAFFSIVLYDIITNTLGMWTLFTATAYGVIGLFAFFYFDKKQPSAWGYAGFAVLGTLFFDAVTGLSVGPLFFHQTFFNALVGQIPFTALHLVGNTTLAFVFSPMIYNFAIKKKRPETEIRFDAFYPQKI